MDIYIDEDLGTDGPDYGSGLGEAAVQTFEYAFSRIPTLYGEDYFLRFSNAAYELPVLAGKYPAGPYRIHLVGSLGLLKSGAIAAALQGSGPAHGTLADAEDLTGYVDKLVLASGQWKLIDSNIDSKTVQLVGTWFYGAPTGSYEVYDWGTRIVGAKGIVGQNLQNIIFDQLDISGTEYAQSSNYLNQMMFHRCKIRGHFGYEAGSMCLMRQCLLSGEESLTYCTDGAKMEAIQCKWIRGSAPWALYIATGGKFYIDGGCVFDGVAPAAGSIGVHAVQGGLAFFDPLHSTSMGAAKIRNFETGIKAITDGKAYETATNVYSGNVTNEAIGLDFGKVQNFAPAWSSTGAIQPAIGNGILTGWTLSVGQLVTETVTLVVGSTTVLGDGVWMFGTAHPVKNPMIGEATGAHAGGAPMGATFWNGSLTSFVIQSSSGQWGKTLPVAWAPGDYLVIQHTYTRK